MHILSPDESDEDNPMNINESFCNSTYEDQIHMEDRELAAFLGAVTELLGPEQAKVSAEDWLDESELMDSPPRSTGRDWRAVTVAASARLVKRLTMALRHRSPLTASAATKVSPIPSSNCLGSTVHDVIAESRPVPCDASNA
jgi:hypothetical protein